MRTRGPGSLGPEAQMARVSNSFVDPAWWLLALPALEIWKLVFCACVSDDLSPMFVKSPKFESTVLLAFHNSVRLSATS